jgi:hypothetical protein
VRVVEPESGVVLFVKQGARISVGGRGGRKRELVVVKGGGMRKKKKVRNSAD